MLVLPPGRCHATRHPQQPQIEATYATTMPTIRTTRARNTNRTWRTYSSIYERRGRPRLPFPVRPTARLKQVKQTGLGSPSPAGAIRAAQAAQAQCAIPRTYKVVDVGAI